ncbi:MAG TPA: hypothetical protein VKF36_01715 [Syntrophorhabdales bacterium]|nr:hypothetical protein [Syntrophorhabdales bacterium]
MGEMDHYLKEQVPRMARRPTGNEQSPVVTRNASDLIGVLKR